MKKEIGKRLKQIRESKNLNQTQFGDSLGILYQHVSKYERGETVPTWENLIKLIELYGVNINWLLTGRGKMMLSSMGYAEIEDATSGNKVKDIEDSEIDEIVEELKKDKELKRLIHNYIKSIWGAKQAAEMLKQKADGLISHIPKT